MDRRGVVVDNITGKPVQGVKIDFYRKTQIKDSLKEKVITDKNGEFFIKEKIDSEQLFQLSKEGYISYTSSLSGERDTIPIEKIEGTRFSDIKIVGAMKNVMWKGELYGRINFDTISNQTGLYGLGPKSFLTGEILISDGICYVSEAVSDSTMIVKESCQTSAPFFVYANVNNWIEKDIPSAVKTIKELETLIGNETRDLTNPFPFKLAGYVSRARIHIQNLPEGTQVSSPQEAHQGQMNFDIEKEKVEVIGFYSKEHAGIFTHHDTYLHMHLITEDKSKMGHLDELEIGKMKLYLPSN